MSFSIFLHKFCFNIDISLETCLSHSKWTCRQLWKKLKSVASVSRLARTSSFQLVFSVLFALMVQILVTSSSSNSNSNWRALLLRIVPCYSVGNNLLKYFFSTSEILGFSISRRLSQCDFLSTSCFGKLQRTTFCKCTIETG